MSRFLNFYLLDRRLLSGIIKPIQIIQNYLILMRILMNENPVTSKKGDKEKDLPCCTLESIVSVDERGQMVIPKEIRESAGLKPGDKLAVILWRGAMGSCCLTLIKTDELKELIRDKLGPIIKDLM